VLLWDLGTLRPLHTLVQPAGANVMLLVFDGRERWGGRWWCGGGGGEGRRGLQPCSAAVAARGTVGGACLAVALSESLSESAACARRVSGPRRAAASESRSQGAVT
jgi:hypothetical protein